MGVIDDMDWDDEYHDAYEDAFAGYHTKKRYNQGKHTRSYEAYDQHHITCKKCGAVGLSWGQVDGRWKLFSPSNELHICITGKAPVVEINLPQKIAEMKERQREKLTRPANMPGHHNQDDRYGCAMFCNNHGDITVSNMDGLMEFANCKYFNHDDQRTDLVTWLMLRAYDSRFDKDQAMAFRLAAMIISRVDPSLY